jgi:predicted phage terminase large subunit-like protein
MRFEADRRCTTGIGWTDPRKVDGELMFPERFPEAQVLELERTLGSYATAGQLQQRPAPRGGGMFKREWFHVVGAAPVGCRWVRGWDLAATDDKAAAYTAGVLIGVAPDGRFYIADSTRIQGTAAQVENLLKATASQDGVAVKGSIPQDPGQAGKMQASYYVKQLAGYDYRASIESGDKETRASPLSAQAEAGNVFLIEGDWNREFLDEMTTFPVGKFKDQVDAASRAFGELVTKTVASTKTKRVAGLI